MEIKPILSISHIIIQEKIVSRPFHEPLLVNIFRKGGGKLQMSLAHEQIAIEDYSPEKDGEIELRYLSEMVLKSIYGQMQSLFVLKNQ